MRKLEFVRFVTVSDGTDTFVSLRAYMHVIDKHQLLPNPQGNVMINVALIAEMTEFDAAHHTGPSPELMEDIRRQAAGQQPLNQDWEWQRVDTQQRAHVRKYKAN